ncbi:MAG: 3'(2'),5'-bisphosphate nucleotidase CysQ [Planctomycetota bacterium]|nr:MAG: 3'(2'),5'-bisphosphate nucleotidase CysQ [Planctomycetota bacterium]
MPDWDEEIRVATQAAREAAAMASAMQATATVSTKTDTSIVTEADLACDQHLRHRIAQAFPEDGLLSEESADDQQRLDQQRVWLIDPIDGTRGFAAGESCWAIHLALAVQGRAVLGVVAIPALNRLYWGIPGAGAWYADGNAAAQSIQATPGPAILALSTGQREGPHPALAQLPAVQRLYTHSVGYKAHLLLTQAAGWCVYPRPIYDWDAAAPAALIQGAGGMASCFDGSPLTFNTPQASSPGLILSTRQDGSNGFDAPISPDGYLHERSSAPKP